MLDAGRVDDAGNAVEAGLVEVGDREVERRLVQQFGQHLLVELGVDLAAAQRHLGDRAHARSRRDADAAQRRDHAAPRRLREVEAAGLRREQVGDVPGDQRAGRGHADEDRARPGADRGRGLLAQRGVRLVADHDRVGVGDPAGVAHEPLVGLDRDRAVGGVVAVEQRRRDAVAVAAVAQLAVELVDEVAAMGEDQHAAGAAGLDEAERRDGLAGAGRVLEPEALVRVGVLGLLLELARRPPRRPASPAAPRPRARRPRGPRRRRARSSSSARASCAGRPLPFAAVAGLAGLRAGRATAVAVAVAVAVDRALGLGEQRGQRARQRVDLVGREHRPVDEVRLLLGEQPLEPEQQRELAAPLDRRAAVARVDLLERGVERAPTGGPWGQGLLDRSPS